MHVHTFSYELGNTFGIFFIIALLVLLLFVRLSYGCGGVRTKSKEQCTPWPGLYQMKIRYSINLLYSSLQSQLSEEIAFPAVVEHLQKLQWSRDYSRGTSVSFSFSLTELRSQFQNIKFYIYIGRVLHRMGWICDVEILILYT